MSDNSLTVVAGGPRDLSLGPLEVEIFHEDSEPIEFVLSSSKFQHRVDLAPGRYTIIARRPNGERLTRSIVLEPRAHERVDLSEQIKPSPNDFMQGETRRGKVVATSRARNATGDLGRITGHQQINLEAIVESARHSGTHVRSDTRLDLRVWNRAGQTAVPQITPGSNFLKVTVDHSALAIGLVNSVGAGPIVMLPPMRQPFDVTFFSEGVASWAADRAVNPSGQRSPVAVVLLAEPAHVDFLALLAEPVVSNAPQVWQQSAHGGSVGDALEALSEKSMDPGAALLAAHFLLRFMPQSLPLGWIDNLSLLMPEAIDGPVIAAWARLLGAKPDDASEDVPKRVSDLVDEAQKRPFAYFARARHLLVKALELDAGLRDADTLTARHRLHLQYGAAAGGLEAFWGRGPNEPGPRSTETASEQLAYRVVQSFMLRGATFQLFDPPILRVP